MKFFVVSLATLTLFAAGCSSPPASIGAPTATTLPSVSVPAAQPSVSPSQPITSTRIELPVIDATWKTYTNNALKFSFQWPTRGRYAPTWGVTFVKDGEAKTSGCASTLNVNGTAFCHVSTEGGSAGSRYFTDMYDTKIEKTNVRFTFTKREANAGSQFDAATYHAHLEQIMGTFIRSL